MNHSRLTSTVASLAAITVLLASYSLTAAAPAQPLRATTSCLTSADRVADFHRLRLRPPSCIRDGEFAAESDHAPCLVVADRVQQWIDLGLTLPRCIRDLQRAAEAR